MLQERAGSCLINQHHHRPQPLHIEPVLGLKTLKSSGGAGTTAGFDCRNRFRFSASTVCCYRNQKPLMREVWCWGALRGGLDPTNVDGAMEKSLDTMFQIAIDYQKGSIFTLHETSPVGGRGEIYGGNRRENAATEGQSDHQPRLCAGNHE